MKSRFFAGIAMIPALLSAQPATADTATDWIEMAIKINNILKAPPGTPPRADRPRATTRVGMPCSRH